MREAARRTALRLTSVAMALLLGGLSCETDLVEDPGFQFWCGTRLCEWRTEQGEIRRTSTWHENDYGVELVGAPVLLAQPFDRGTGRCSLVEAVTKIDPEAEVFVEIDEDDDGIPEWERQLESSEDFIARSWEAEVNVSGENIITLDPDSDPPPGTASIRKVGDGDAIIARIRISRECSDD